jgi:hypothetical protein
VIGVELDWSSAEVHEGTLEVSLSGELPKGWKKRFEETLNLLPGGDWGKISLKKDRVRVRGVAQGGEDRLHHFLESVVLQANTVDEPKEPEPDGKEDQADPVDNEMTERFRSFAAGTRGADRGAASA